MYKCHIVGVESLYQAMILVLADFQRFWWSWSCNNYKQRSNELFTFSSSICKIVYYTHKHWYFHVDNWFIDMWNGKNARTLRFMVDKCKRLTSLERDEEQKCEDVPLFMHLIVLCFSAWYTFLAWSFTLQLFLDNVSFHRVICI